MLGELSMATRLLGRCMCGASTYEVSDNFEYALNCHCSKCRQTTGSAFKPMAGIRLELLRLTSGNETVLSVGDESAKDIHCGLCGSLLYSIVREGTYAHVTMGTLIDTPAIRLAKHIFVASKAPWFEITDDLPQFPGMG
jgi:hypothetical protein